MRTIPPLLILSILTLTSCSFLSGPRSELIRRLDGRGPVLVSDENPFIAANLLLTREMESHPEMKGFFDKRGMPAAIEVLTEYFSPTIVLAYYPAKRQVYTFEQGEESWIISGPSPLTKEKLDRVTAISAGASGPFPRGTAPRPSLGDEAMPKPDVDSPTPLKAPVVLTPNTAQIPSTGFQSPPRPLPSRFEMLVKESADTPAEISPRGDLVHYVTFPGESLLMISRWYTLDAANSGTIARINHLKNASSLALGDTVVIPNYLLKNKNRLSEKAVEVFRKEGSGIP